MRKNKLDIDKIYSVINEEAESVFSVALNEPKTVRDLMQNIANRTDRKRFDGRKKDKVEDLVTVAVKEMTNDYIYSLKLKKSPNKDD